jgi:hypothetical protein
MKRAAAAAWDMIQLADQGYYSLVPFSNYQDNFCKNDGTYPWTTETIFMKMEWTAATRGEAFLGTKLGRVYTPSRMLGNSSCEGVNQLYVDKFEMADGSRYQTAYDTDNVRRWDDRDPRFRMSIGTDRYKWGLAAQTVLRLWNTPATSDKTTDRIPTCYIVKKYWPLGANAFDRIYTNALFRTPLMRLADVYLIYAEAVNEAYGPDGSVPGASLTAVGAVNKIRQRAGMPDVTAAATGYDSFRDLVRNERNVELCFEGHYWDDIRRWYIAHLPENKEIVDLIFDQNWTTFERRTILTRVFDDPKHYWMPIQNSQTQIYKEFYQNPGW